MSNYPYGLYLDSKIIGTAKQIVSFYDNKVFCRKDTIVYIRKYKVTGKKYKKIFKDAQIPFRFMRPSELDVLVDQIIFYPFNAQSNCRFVANRQLKHVFITHGESNKIASVKPIIRIYDFIISSGDWGVERYLNSGLFTQHDVDRGRLIKMGDTFIGRTGFSNDSTCENIICYAPTWEGGLEQENYSSVGFDLVGKTLLLKAQECHIKTIVFKPHPNLGHRRPEYVDYLIKTMRYLIKNSFKVLIYGDPELFPLHIRLQLKLYGIKWLEQAENYYPVYAYTDISAMETQCLHELIKYQPFYLNKMLNMGMTSDQQSFYKAYGVSLEGVLNVSPSLDRIIYSNLFTKVIGYSDEKIRVSDGGERIKWLSDHIMNKK